MSWFVPMGAAVSGVGTPPGINIHAAWAFYSLGDTLHPSLPRQVAVGVYTHLGKAGLYRRSLFSPAVSPSFHRDPEVDGVVLGGGEETGTGVYGRGGQFLWIYLS